MPNVWVKKLYVVKKEVDERNDKRVGLLKGYKRWECIEMRMQRE